MKNKANYGILKILYVVTDRGNSIGDLTMNKICIHANNMANILSYDIL